MVSKSLLSITLMFVIVFSCQSLAESPVWKVSKGDNSLYIGGTFHLLSKTDHPLPEAFEKAYAETEKVVLETDFQVITSLEFQQKMTIAMMLDGGRTLQSELKPETFAALSDYFAARSLPIENFMPFTPAGVALTITILEYQKLGMSADAGVDYVFASRAINDGKPLGHLESPEEQLAFISTLGQGQEDALMMHTLREIGSMDEGISALKKSWRKGDAAAMENLAMTPMRKQFPGIYTSLLSERNAKWLPKIENMLRDAPVEFVLVGALHLVGEDGVIALLEAKGYQLTNL